MEKMPLPPHLAPPRKQVKPWEYVRESLASRPRKATVFKAIQKDGGSFVDSRGALYTERTKQGIAIGAWDESEMFIGFMITSSQFMPPDQCLLPRLYSTLSETEKMIERMCGERDKGGNSNIPPHIGLAYWIHPDEQTIPLRKYRGMTGGQFPGSPRQ